MAITSLENTIPSFSSVITEEPADVTVHPDETAVFVCVGYANTSSPDLFINWHLNGQFVFDLPDLNYTESNMLDSYPGAFNCSLRVVATLGIANSTVQCRVYDLDTFTGDNYVQAAFSANATISIVSGEYLCND